MFNKQLLRFIILLAGSLLLSACGGGGSGSDVNPSLTITDNNITEGDSGNSTASLTVTLADFTDPVDVDYTTSDGTATADSDYATTSGTLSFTGGSTSETIDITVHGDTVRESDETIIVTLSNPINAELGSPANATLTINNDDFSLNDTGLTWSGDYSSGNNSNCIAGSNSENNVHTEQDCSHGRDVAYNDDTDGHAGFNFAKLDANGNELDVSAGSWSCVRDNVTGLVWEVKTDDDGLRDKDKGYAWGGDTARLNADFGTRYDDWDALINAANAENTSGLCGYSDWRVPSREELRSIVSYDRTGPAIDTSFFPNTISSFYWSSSANAGGSSSAWDVNFDDGDVDYSYRSLNEYVRLVRAGQ